METKSRYEVISDLEAQKRNLIMERDSYPDKIRAMERDIRDAKRHIEDKEEELNHFKGRVEERKETLKELIASVDESLKRFEGSFPSQKK